MLSFHHEALLQLFRNRPRLAPELLRDALNQPLPELSDVRVESADLTNIQPAEYRADLVVVVGDDAPVVGVVIEVQLGRDETKKYSWPVYVVSLRARLGCPVYLLVIVADDAVARWAATPIGLGGDSYLTPYVLSPERVPLVVDEATARADPELAVLSVMAHAQRVEPEISLQMAAAALAASARLDADRVPLYGDLVYKSIPEVVRRALQAMNPANYEFQSEFARRYFSLGEAKGQERGKVEGRAEGKAEGKAELVITLATRKFGPLAEQSLLRIRAASASELDQFAMRLLEAPTLDAMFREG